MAGQDKKGSSKAPAEKEDKLDLNLSPPHFLHLLAMMKHENLLLSMLKKIVTACQSLLIRVSVTWTIALISHVEPKHFPLLILSEAVNPNDRRQRTCAQQRLFVSTHHQAADHGVTYRASKRTMS